jgi:hypothetical protein
VFGLAIAEQGDFPVGHDLTDLLNRLRSDAGLWLIYGFFG